VRSATSGQVSENRRLTARQRWLRQHKKIRLYLKRDEYELLESLASEEGLTAKDFIVKLASEPRQLKAESSTLRTLGVECKPTSVIECVSKLRERLVIQMLEYAVCKEHLERLKKKP
jgi:hypothetical protein